MAGNAWSYVDAQDLAEALLLAAVSELPGHEIFYVAAPDNLAGQPLAGLVRQYYGSEVELRITDREDASGISCSKAVRMLGYAPRRSWRDFLEFDGTPRADRPDTSAHVETVPLRCAA